MPLAPKDTKRLAITFFSKKKKNFYLLDCRPLYSRHQPKGIMLILLCWKLHATKNGPALKQSTTPITFKSNDNHQSKGRVMTELLYIRIFNRYARKDTKERTRLNPIKSPVSPFSKVSPLLTMKNSAKLKTQFPLLRILLTWASEQVPPCPSRWFLFCSSRPRSQSTLLMIPQYPFHHLLWPWQKIASTDIISLSSSLQVQFSQKWHSLIKEVRKLASKVATTQISYNWP